MDPMYPSIYTDGHMSLDIVSRNEIEHMQHMQQTLLGNVYTSDPSVNERTWGAPVLRLLSLGIFIALELINTGFWGMPPIFEVPRKRQRHLKHTNQEWVCESLILSTAQISQVLRFARCPPWR
jgi:hypothetical protein